MALDANFEVTLDGLSQESLAAFDNDDLSWRDSQDGLVDEPTGAEESTETPTGKPSSTRDEKGRFVKQQAEGETPEQATETPTEAAPATSATTPFPSSWKRELASHWETLPEDVRQEVARRESNFHEELGKYRQATDYASQWLPIRDRLLDLRNAFGSEVEGVKKMMELSDFAGQNPREFIAWFCQSKGLDPATVLTEATQTVQQYDPRVPQLQGELENLKRVAAEEAAARQRAIDEQAVRQVEEFGRDKPDFQQLRGEMAALIQAGLAQDLESAYVKARAWYQSAPGNQVSAQQPQEPAPSPTEVNVPKTGAPPQVKKRRGNMDSTLRELAERLF